VSLVLAETGHSHFQKGQSVAQPLNNSFEFLLEEEAVSPTYLDLSTANWGHGSRTPLFGTLCLPRIVESWSGDSRGYLEQTGLRDRPIAKALFGV
jgi:hypothetical protein